MNVPWVLCPSEDPVSICEAINQDWVQGGEGSPGQKSSIHQPFLESLYEPSTGLGAGM